jgi:hypothetical protein
VETNLGGREEEINGKIISKHANDISKTTLKLRPTK